MATQLLESFDAPPAISERDEAFEQGRQAGYEQALSTHQAQQVALTEQLVQAAKDLEFQFAEARSELLSALRPLFTTLCETIIPQVADQGFTLQLVAALEEAADAVLPQRFTLTLCPAQADALRHASRDLPATVTIQADPQQPQNALTWHIDSSATHYDFGGLMKQVQAILEPLTEQPEGSQQHG